MTLDEMVLQMDGQTTLSLELLLRLKTPSASQNHAYLLMSQIPSSNYAYQPSWQTNSHRANQPLDFKNALQ